MSHTSGRLGAKACVVGLMALAIVAVAPGKVAAFSSFTDQAKSVRIDCDNAKAGLMALRMLADQPERVA